MKALEQMPKALLAQDERARSEKMSFGGRNLSYSRKWRQVFMAASTYPGGTKLVNFSLSLNN